MSDKELSDAEYDALLNESEDDPETPQAEKSHQSTSLQQLFALQKRVFSDALSQRTDPMLRCSLVKAWDILEERKRILRNKPLPGSLNQKLERKPASAPLIQLSPSSEIAA